MLYGYSSPGARHTPARVAQLDRPTPAMREARTLADAGQVARHLGAIHDIAPRYLSAFAVKVGEYIPALQSQGVRRSPITAQSPLTPDAFAATYDAAPAERRRVVHLLRSAAADSRFPHADPAFAAVTLHALHTYANLPARQQNAYGIDVLSCAALLAGHGQPFEIDTTLHALRAISAAPHRSADLVQASSQLLSLMSLTADDATRLALHDAITRELDASLKQRQGHTLFPSEPVDTAIQFWLHHTMRNLTLAPWSERTARVQALVDRQATDRRFHNMLRFYGGGAGQLLASSYVPDMLKNYASIPWHSTHFTVGMDEHWGLNPDIGRRLLGAHDPLLVSYQKPIHELRTQRAGQAMLPQMIQIAATGLLPSATFIPWAVDPINREQQGDIALAIAAIIAMPESFPAVQRMHPNDRQRRGTVDTRISNVATGIARAMTMPWASGRADAMIYYGALAASPLPAGAHDTFRVRVLHGIDPLLDHPSPAIRRSAHELRTQIYAQPMSPVKQITAGS